MPRIEPAQARLLFSTAEVARLATVTPAGAPHIVPITFALDGDFIYTAVDAKPKSTAVLQRLRNIKAEPRASALADHYHRDWARLWWSRADGHASVLQDPAETAGPLALLARRHAQYREQPPAGPVIAIQVARWSAWAAEPR